MNSLAPELALADRYTLVERIAVGGMGEVWRARDELLGRSVAVKVLKAEYAADPSFVQRFRNEARHTASLSHPGIANVYDYGEVGDMAFLVMELVVGEPLSTLLAREGRLEPRQALDVIGQAALALQAAHDAGVVHRDVKPGNLLVRPDGVVKVTDFGIARAVDAAPVTKTGMLVGTAAYLSPEQAAGRSATAASDIYSLGVVAYECLSGERPFAADSAVAVAMAHINATPAPLPDSVPPLVADFVMRALEKDPARRQPSAGDFGRTALALAAQLDRPATDTAVVTDTAVLTDTAALTDTALLAPSPATTTMTTPGDDDDRERRRIRNIFIAVGAGVVILGFLFLHSCTSGGVAEAHVPRVVGESFATAEKQLQARGFTVARHGRSDLHIARGVVLTQSARAGSLLAVGRTVTLTVSRGPASVTLDPADYVGRPVADVQAQLQSMHLLVTVVSLPGGGAPGTVTAIDPTGPVREGTTVTVTVAVNPAPAHGPKPAKPTKHKPPGHEGHDH